MWEPVEVLEHRPAQLVNGSERQLHLGLDAPCSGDPTVDGLFGDVRQEGSLADARLTVDDERTACPRADILNQPVEAISLGTSTLEVDPMQSHQVSAPEGILPT